MAADMSHSERHLMPTGMSFVTGNVSESWKRFKQKLNFYFRGVPETRLTNQRKIGILMTALGDGGLDVYNTFRDINESSTFDEVMEAFEKYCNPRRNTVYERFLFSQIVQGASSVDSFLVALKSQATRCAFSKEEADNLIRDRLVVGIRNPAVRKELLRDSELTLDTAAGIARAWERSETEATAISAYVPPALREAENVAVDRVETRSRPSLSSKSSYPSCSQCSYTHPPDRCPAEGRECNYCKEKNHFISVCPKKAVSRREPTSSVQPAPPVEPAVRNIEESVASDLSMLHICSIDVNASKSWVMPVEIGNIVVRFKLDTGAECNVLSLADFEKLAPRPPLRPSPIRLRAFNASTVIVPVGEIVVACRFNGKSRKVSFLVIRGAVGHAKALDNLIGLPTIVELGLVRRTCAVQTAPLGITEHPVTSEFAHLFQGLGKVPGLYEFTVRDGVSPVVSKPRRFPFSMKEPLCAALRKLEKQGIICAVTEPTAWVSNLVVVKKPSGDLRLCLDPHNLNEAIMIPKFQIPKADDILVQLHGCRYFTVLDLTNGFWQLELTKASSMLTTFNSPLGRFRFTRMCFGVSSAPEIFMGEMAKFFGDLPGVAPYFDDLIIAGSTRAEHDNRLRQVMVRASQLNIRFNVQKMQLCRPSVSFLGFELSAEGVKPQAKHIRAIVDMPAPTDRNGVLRVLGMVRYLSRFIPSLSQSTENMRNLTKKRVPFLWGPSHQAEFEALKNTIVRATNLKFYDPTQPLWLQTDSSKSGIGCCMYQSAAPLAYASRALTETERRYAQIEKELLAVVYSLEHFHDYTYGREVAVVTDHRPLLALVKKPIADVPPRLQRLCLRLMRYSFQLVYKPGRELLVADTLSRAYLEDEPADESYQLLDVHAALKVVASPENYEKLVVATNTDPDLQALKICLRGGWPKSKARYTQFLRKCRTFADRLTFANDLCFYENRLFVPSSCVTLFLERLHAGHLNVNKTLQLAKQSVFWIGMTADIREFVESCPTCNKWRRNNCPETLKSYPLAERPWQRLHMDILTESSRDFLVIYDSYSHWLELFPLRSKSVSEIVLILKSLFSRFGVPSQIVSDNSPFHSAEYLGFARDWSFEPLFSSPRYPQANGLSEKAVAIAKSILRKNPSDVCSALLQYRVAPIPHVGYSPSQLLMSRTLNTKSVIAASCLRPALVDAKLVQQRKMRQQTSQEQYFNRGARDLPPLATGDAVLFKKDLGDSQWRTGTVQTPATGPRSYVVADDETGRAFLRNRRFIRKPARFRD